MLEKYINSRGKREKRVCENCNCEFITLSIKVRQGGEKFCSVGCYSSFRKSNSNTDNSAIQRKYRYGINKEDFNLMLLSCNNSCEICDQDFDLSERSSIPFIDHCHKTNKIRGLLCSNCNSGIGFLKDNKEFILKAAQYIDKYSE